ncbi:MAG: SPOR domain-containing protein [Steroidobacteraceae bacterium]|jgi:cell division septation protein DedD
MDIKIRVAALALALALGIGVAGCSREQSDWEKARAANNADSYELFVKKYPTGSFTGQAQARLKELYEDRDWQKARDTDTPEAYQVFLKQYPEGKWTEEARIRVENFSLAQQAPSGTPPATEAAPGAPGSGAAAAAGAAAAPAKPKPSAPAPRPNARAAAKSAPLPKPAVTPVTNAGGGDTVIQLGAFKSGTAAANHHWERLEKRFPTVLKGLTPTVKSSSAPAAPLYRLQVTGLTQAAAHAICKTLKAKKQACVVLPKVHHQ